MGELFSFFWTIDNFKWCRCDAKETMESPVFVADTPCQTHWKLILYPKGFDGKHISCYLQCHEYNENLENVVDFEIAILRTNNDVHCSSAMENVHFSRKKTAGFERFASLNMLAINENESLPAGTLIIQCHLKASRLPVGSFVKDLDSLSRAFKRMFEFGNYNDLMLLKKDLKFPAHKAILGVRSIKYFRSIEMSPNDDMEVSNPVWEVDAGDVYYEAFRHFLLYLYSGVIESTDPVVWCQLYEMAECYEIFDMKRDIFPTITKSAVRTRIPTKTKSVYFRIKNFSIKRLAALGRFIDLDFARVSVEYCSDSRNSKAKKMCFTIVCYTSDTNSRDGLYCTISVLDVDGHPHYSSVHEIMFASDSRTTLRISLKILEFETMSHKFLINDTITVKFTFTIVTGFVLSKIVSEKVGRALCLGHESPSKLALNRMSRDYESLVEWNEVESKASDWLVPEATNFQKAVFSAWSPARERTIHTIHASSSPIFQTKNEKLVFRFLCTGHIRIPTIQTALCVYTIASNFEIHCLKNICYKDIESKLSIDNAMQNLLLTQTHKCFDCVSNFVCNHFDQINVTDEWKHFASRYPLIIDRIYRRLDALNSNFN